MPSNENWRILVVDDEQDVREVVAFALTDADYCVATAADGLAGLEQCREFGPHIVITDIRMPRMDGLRLLEQIKLHHPDIEVIVATAFGDMASAVRALQLDASDFITKPVDSNVLMVAIERACQRATTRKELKSYNRYLKEGWAETSQKLSETFAYQHKLIESSIDGILGCNASDTVVTYNASLEVMLGFQKSAVLQRMKLSQFFEPADYDAFRKTLADKGQGGPNRLYHYETRLRAQDGHTIPVQLSAAAINDRDRMEGLVCFTRDLRRIRQLEQEMADQARILHQDKMISLGRLAASVAHEINNPLAGVLNYLRLMLHTAVSPPMDPNRLSQFQHYTQVCEQEVARCAKIVGNLLTFARTTPDDFQPVEIGPMLQRCIDLGRHRLDLQHIELTSEWPANLPMVKGDASQLQQCLLNLIFNAIDAMPSGGRLELRASGNHQALTIAVSDTGCGIAPEDEPHIFEPFFTTKQDGSGTGLGLATTYGIIERHLGTIAVKSRPGSGTMFTIKLPVET